MRILVLAPQPFMTQRGTPLATKMLLETLSRCGYRMDVMIFAEGEDVDIEGCSFTRVPAVPGLGNISPGFSVKKLLCDGIMFPMIVWKLLRTRYDLIIAVEESAYFSMLLRPFFRVPYIVDVDSSIPEQLADKYDMPGWLHKAVTAAERTATRHALAAITCCQALRDGVLRHAPGLPVQVLEDVTMLSDADAAEQPSDLATDHPIIMYVGNLESYQGVDLLLESFALLDQEDTPAELVIIGGAEGHLAHYTARAQDLGIADRVRFLGPRPVEKLGVYLRAAAITVSPRTQGRNTPMKVYSYLDSGRPLVATRLSTHTQVLDDEISVLVNPTAASMAQGFAILLRDPGLRDRIGAAARARVAQEFSPEAYNRKLTGFFQREIAPRLGSATDREVS